MFFIPIQIRLSDLDTFGHVNNGAQCNYFDCGRLAYIAEVCGRQLDWTNLDLILVHNELDFKSAILMHDDIVCETKVYEIGNKSIKILQRLVDRKTGVLKTISHSVLASFDKVQNCAVPLSDEYRKKFAEYENL